MQPQSRILVYASNSQVVDLQIRQRNDGLRVFTIKIGLLQVYPYKTGGIKHYECPLALYPRSLQDHQVGKGEKESPRTSHHVDCQLSTKKILNTTLNPKIASTYLEERRIQPKNATMALPVGQETVSASNSGQREKKQETVDPAARIEIRESRILRLTVRWRQATREDHNLIY